MVKAQNHIKNHTWGKEQKKLTFPDADLEGELDLTKFVNLEEIDLSNNRITKLILGENTKLTKINISNNSLLKGLDFSGIPNLQVLDISNSNFDDEVQGYRLEGNGKNLTTLRCSQNRLRINTLNRINVNTEKLEELDIRNNKFGEGNLERLSKFTKIRILKIGNDNDTKIKNLERFNKFGHPKEGNNLSCLKNLKNLEQLHIGNTYINTGLEWLPANLKEIEFESGPETNKMSFKSDKLKEQLDDFRIGSTNRYDLEKWRQSFPLYKSFAKEQRKNNELEEENDKLTQQYNKLVDLVKEEAKRMTEKDNVIAQKQSEIEKLNQLLVNENEVAKRSQEKADQLGIKLGKEKEKLTQLKKKFAKKNARWEEKNASFKISFTKLKDQVEIYRERERERESQTPPSLPREAELQKLRSWLTNEQQAHQKTGAALKAGKVARQKLKNNLTQVQQDLKTVRQKVDDYETHLKKELEISNIKDWKSALVKLKQKPNQERMNNGVEETKLKEAQNKYLVEKDRREKVEKQLRKIKTILVNLQGKENIPSTEWQGKWNELLVVVGNNSSGKKPPQPTPHPPKSPPKPTDNNEKKGNNKTGLGEINTNNSAELNQAQQELEALKMEKLSLERQVGSLHKKLEMLSTQNTLILVGGGFLIIILIYLLFSLPKKKSTKEN